MRRAYSNKQRQEYLLHAVNSTAAVLLLAPTDGEDFKTSLLKGIEIIGRCAEVDRICIWRNETIDGVFCYVNQFYWVSDAVRWERIPVMKRAYSEISEWERKFLRNEYVNAPLSALTQQEQNMLGPQGVKSILSIPLYLHGQFYGFFSFDDCRRERTFTEDEVEILRSAGLMLVSAIIRDTQAAQLLEAHERVKLMLDATPLACSLWDSNYKLFDCNAENIKLFGIKDKQEFLDHFLDLSPEYQPDGRLSSEKCATYLKKAFKEGTCVFEWMHRTPDGAPLPAEVTLVRIIYDEDYVVASYARDLRQYKQMMKEIEQRDYLLNAALEEARQANRAKSDFLANMSHEMRTPLNAIIGLSKITLESGILSGETNLNLEKVYNAGMALLSLVNDILDISKIESGKFELVPIEYDVPSLLNDAITQSMMHKDEKPIEFELDIDEELPTRLYGDELRVRQIFNNLLSNAFKYTKEGTVKLDVSCTREGAVVWMTVRVRDTGIGVRPDDLSKLFSDYAQLDAKSNRTVGGTGLGLAITKRLAEMMSGEISVESEYGKGSQFTARFLQQKIVTGAVIGPEVVHSLKNFQYSDQKRHKNFNLVRIRLPYARVLVVDDVPTNLDVARGMLKTYGMHIDCAASGQQAIDAIRSEQVRYSAVFMDHMMPGMDGIEATRIIREEIGTEYARTIPIIALTANAIVGNEEMFLSKGFQAFLPKPIDIVRLDAIIRQWVRDKTLENAPVNENNNAELPEKTAEPLRNFSWPAQVDGVDLQKGFERFGNDEESFLQVLHSYVFNTVPLLEAAKAVTRENLADYAIIVHGIKGSSRGICADTAGDMAYALEKAAREGNIDFVTANNAAFIQMLAKLIGDLDSMLRQMTSVSPKPKRDKPDGGVLERLLAACKDYDMDGVDAAMAELACYEYESDDGLVVWLQENAEAMNLAQIVERLS